MADLSKETTQPDIAIWLPRRLVAVRIDISTNRDHVIESHPHSLHGYALKGMTIMVDPGENEQRKVVYVQL